MTISLPTLTYARDVIVAAADAASTAYKELAAELTSARDYDNDALSTSGIAAERERRTDEVKRTAAGMHEQLTRHTQTQVAFVRRVLDQERPKITDWAQASAAWERARMYLDNGHSLHHVLTNADVPMVLAVETYGPDFLRAQRDPSKLIEVRFSSDGSDPISSAVKQLQHAVALRLAELVDDEGLVIALRLSVQLDEHLAAANAWWDGIDAVANGRTFDQLRAAAQRRLSDQAAAAQLA